MAAGDWGAGAYGVVQNGVLNALSAGEAGAVDVNYWVVLPSGGRVFNGGRQGPNGELVPFHFQADDSQPLQTQAIATVVALAQDEGFDIHLTTSIVHPDGTVTPIT